VVIQVKNNQVFPWQSLRREIGCSKFPTAKKIGGWNQNLDADKKADATIVGCKS